MLYVIMYVMLFKVTDCLTSSIMMLSHCGYSVDILERRVPFHIYCFVLFTRDVKFSRPTWSRGHILRSRSRSRPPFVVLVLVLVLMTLFSFSCIFASWPQRRTTL